MEVVRHQRVRVHLDTEPSDDLLVEQSLEQQEVGLAAEDVLPIGTTVEDVEPVTGTEIAISTCHATDREHGV